MAKVESSGTDGRFGSRDAGTDGKVEKGCPTPLYVRVVLGALIWLLTADALNIATETILVHWLTSASMPGTTATRGRNSGVWYSFRNRSALNA